MIRISMVLAALVLAACGDAGTAREATVPPPPATAPATAPTSGATPAGCADVVDAEAEPDGEGTYRFSVTVRSADTGVEKYADLWEVRSPDGEVLGERVLLHPHVNEQPFTRSLAGVAVPAAITEVVIAARDSVAGFCGATATVGLG